uniref:Uncharacterized protein n=1 Tax=Mayetiola destructor TaxID=39758 RepID=D1MLM5_MAYDE|nr:hypothetical protein [Mayetiola destructor]
MAQGNFVSRTGLSASPKKVQHIQRFRKSKHLDEIVAECAQTKPVQYSIRPFAALFSPYSRNCSILCNHPGPNEIKQVVKKAKELYIEWKGNSNTNNDNNYLHVCGNDENCELIHSNQIVDSAKDQFYQHYAGSDSRPLTPTPTVISNRTRFYARRCHTPDPVHTCATERKQLVLDLRRSHSQETVYCNASSELSFYVGGDSSVITSKIDKPTIIIQPPKNIRLCEQEARKRSAELKSLQQLEQINESAPVICINDRNDTDGEIEVIRRRGKKKKKSKQGNSFRMNQEPETQITTIDPDSLNASARPTGNIVAHKTAKDDSISRIGESIRDDHYLRSNFITEDALRILRRGLNIDIVESAFEKFMSTALREALQTIPKSQLETDGTVLSEFKTNFSVKTVDNEKWLKMPRKFTRSATRFSLPINTVTLETLTPFEYLSRYVWISDHRKHLYRFVFNKFLNKTNNSMDADCNELDGDQQECDTPSNDTTTITNKSQISFCIFTECKIPFEQLQMAFVDVLGYCGPVERCTDKVIQIMELIELNANNHSFINFRSWCGLVAFAERFLNEVPFDLDPSDEVEIADFETLDRKFSSNAVPNPLKSILMIIKRNNNGK